MNTGNYKEYFLLSKFAADLGNGQLCDKIHCGGLLGLQWWRQSLEHCGSL